MRYMIYATSAAREIYAAPSSSAFSLRFLFLPLRRAIFRQPGCCHYRPKRAAEEKRGEDISERRDDIYFRAKDDIYAAPCAMRRRAAAFWERAIGSLCSAPRFCAVPPAPGAWRQARQRVTIYDGGFRHAFSLWWRRFFLPLLILYIFHARDLRRKRLWYLCRRAIKDMIYFFSRKIKILLLHAAAPLWYFCFIFRAAQHFYADIFALFLRLSHARYERYAAAFIFIFMIYARGKSRRWYFVMLMSFAHEARRVARPI